MLKIGFVISFSPEAEALIKSIVDALSHKPQVESPVLDHEVPLMARYKFTEDQDPVSFPLVFTGGHSKKGTAVGAADVDLTVESSIAAITAEISNQKLSDDGNSVSADVTLTGGTMEQADLAVVTYKATNRDTGNVIAADTDEFETGPGEVAIGTLDSPVPLPEVAPAAPPAAPPASPTVL